MRNSAKSALLWLTVAILPWSVQLNAGERLAKQDDAELTSVLDAEEVTAANIDLSPDGKSIAFDLLGHVFTVSSTGGDATQLTLGTAWNSRPVWSPDGTRIAFISDASGVEQIHVVPASGSSESRQITTISSTEELQDHAQILQYVEWLHDGRGIVVDGRVVTFEHPDLGMELLDPAQRVRVDGAGVLVAVNSDSVNTSFPKSGLWRVDISSGAKRLVVETDDETYLPDALLSQDGLWVVYNERHAAKGQQGLDGSLRLKNTKTGETRELISSEEMLGWKPVQEWKNARSALKRMDITSDSRFLYLNFKGKLWRVNLETGERTSLRLNARVQRPYSRPILSAQEVGSGDRVTILSARNLSKSPSGGRVAFSAARAIYQKDLRTHSIRKLLDQPGLGQYQPTYSPDGTRIAFVTWDDVTRGQVWVSPVEGGTATPVMPAPGFYRDPVWTPDGRSILLFSANQEKDLGGYRRRAPSSIVMVDVGSSAVRTVVESAALDIGLSVSSDGATVYFVPYDQGQVARYIASTDLKTGKSRVITRQDYLPPEQNFTAVRVSPDGATAAIVKYGDLYLEELGADSKGLPRSQRVTYNGAGEPAWSANGLSLTWTFGGKSCERQFNGREFSTHQSSDSRRKIDKTKVRCESINLKLPRKRNHGSIALRNARIVSMRGDEIIAHGTVLISGQRITAVGRTSDVVIPSDAMVYELGGRVVIPGLIDMHAHANTASVFLDPAPVELQAYLAYGVTTLRDPSSGGDYAFAYGEMIEAGLFAGPRLFNTVGLLANMHRVNDEQDAIDLVARLKSMGATMVKLHTGWNRNQRRWIIAAARVHGLNVVAHLADSYVFQARADLSQVSDGVTSVEHELVLETLPYRDVMGFMEILGARYTPTHLSTSGGYQRKYWKCMQGDQRFSRFPPSKEPKRATSDDACQNAGLVDLDEPGASLSRIAANGLSRGAGVLVGSHGDYDGFGFHWELWAHAKGGLTNHEALKLATLGNAHGLGMDREIGSIEVGKIADMIVLDADPLIGIKNSLTTVSVIKDGVIYDPRTLQEMDVARWVH